MKALFAVMAAALAECILLGMGVPVIPLFVVKTLQYGAGMVGSVTGIQFITAMIFRFPSGRLSDVRGPYFAMAIGALSGVLAGIFYILADIEASMPLFSVMLLFAGSAFLGISQSVLVTGAMTGAVSLAHAEKQKNEALGTGKSSQGAGAAVSWIGMCVFVGLILGAPLGAWGFEAFSLSMIGAFIAFFSLLVMLWCHYAGRGRLAPPVSAAPCPESEGTESHLESFLKAFEIAWFPGICFGLCAVCHGLVLAYGSLLYAAHHWSPLWLPFAVFAVGLILARVTLGGLPDKWGGAQTAFLSGGLEMAGLALVGLSANFYLVGLGIFLTGFGFAFSFPAFVLITLQKGSAAQRGVLIGVCNALGDGVRGLGIVCLGYLSVFGGFLTIFLSGAGLSLLGGLGGLLLVFSAKRRKMPVVSAKQERE